MSFVQALKRLITTNDASSSSSSSTSGTPTSGATISESNQSLSEHSTNAASSNTNSNGSHSTATNLKTKENFKPLSQGLQKKYARGVQYNSKIFCSSRTKIYFD